MAVCLCSSYYAIVSSLSVTFLCPFIKVQKPSISGTGAVNAPNCHTFLECMFLFESGLRIDEVGKWLCRAEWFDEQLFQFFVNLRVFLHSSNLLFSPGFILCTKRSKTKTNQIIYNKGSVGFAFLYVAAFNRSGESLIRWPPMISVLL